MCQPRTSAGHPLIRAWQNWWISSSPKQGPAVHQSDYTEDLVVLLRTKEGLSYVHQTTAYSKILQTWKKTKKKQKKRKNQKANQQNPKNTKAK